MLHTFRRRLTVSTVAVLAFLSVGLEARARTIDREPLPAFPVRRFYTPLVDTVLGPPGGRTYVRASDRPPSDSNYQISYWWTRAPGEDRWRLLSGQKDFYSPVILAPDPARPDTVYVVDGSGFVRRSLDAGATWQTRGPSPSESELPQLLVVGDELLLLDYDQCLPCRSRDGGKTWETGTAELPGDLVPAPGDPRVVYSFSCNAIFRSSDGARSFTDVSPAEGEGAAELAVAPADARTVYALAVDAGKTSFLSRTRDGGATWTRLPPPEPGLIWSGLAVDPASASHLAILGGFRDPSVPHRLFESFDGGDSWTARARPVKATSLRFTTGPGGPALEAFGGRGLFTTADSGNIWKLTDQGIQADGDLLLAGAANGDLYVYAPENWTLWRSRNGGRDWELRGTRRLGSVATYYGSLTIDPFNHEALVALDTSASEMLWSVDGGKSWVSRHGPETADGPLGVGSLSFDLHQRDKVYAATWKDAWVSTDRGVTWSLLTATLPSGTDCNLYHCWEDRGIAEVVPDPFRPRRLYVRAMLGYNYFRTDDGGATWKFIDPFGQAVEGPRLLPDPRIPDRVYWGVRYEAQIYESHGAGDLPWRVLLRTSDTGSYSTREWYTFDPEGRLFVASEWQRPIFLRQIGRDWERLRIGLPVEDVALQEPLLPLPGGRARMFVIAPGLGLFQSDLPAPAGAP